MIRKLMKEEYKNAINLSYQVCIECGINDFTEEGIETFKSFVYDTSLMNTLEVSSINSIYPLVSDSRTL